MSEQIKEIMKNTKSLKKEQDDCEGMPYLTHSFLSHR